MSDLKTGLSCVQDVMMTSPESVQGGKQQNLENVLQLFYRYQVTHSVLSFSPFTCHFPILIKITHLNKVLCGMHSFILFDWSMEIQYRHPSTILKFICLEWSKKNLIANSDSASWKDRCADFLSNRDNSWQLIALLRSWLDDMCM